MDEGRKFRNELKYICSKGELLILKSRVHAVMKSDANATADGTYLIKSIYFDDYDNTSFGEKDSGTDPRGKWRIRAYNNDDSTTRLEFKYKEHCMISKDSCCLTRSEFDGIMEGTARIGDVDSPVFRRFMIDVKSHHMVPAIIVQYVRRPFVHALGNVRVTFDTDISSSKDYDKFFEPDLSVRPIMPIGQGLLEVKYDQYIPDHIYHALQLKDMRQETFSKYCLCRQFSIGGIV